ncbi:MAG: methylenetetrahydrofolate reductase [NAD(P)H] [Clostridia bacterium]|nr:methylenetetrahydrofolate reductase [NAD(P)H] [Clostridia bacterium]MBR5773035.1 methylenetetrahydrofolate reductase [NAD(P)H] [Clostridia bacterium]
MKIKEILNNGKLNLSFEVFPPKTDSSFDSVISAVNQIAALKPSFMSVTYGAGGGVSRYTLDIAENIKEKYNVPSLAHLTCISSTKDNIEEMIGKIKSSGIENVLALRGDIPENFSPEGRDYTHAIDLVREIKTVAPEICVGGACYPEVHPESPNRNEDIKHLKEKAEAGCDFFTTQMFFDNNLLYSFLYRIREAGITVPIVAGIMPITNANQVERAIKLSGSHMPQRFKSLVDKFGDNPQAMMQAGIAYATDQVIDLYANNITNVHIYSMNKPEVAQSIMNNLSHIIDK